VTEKNAINGKRKKYIVQTKTACYGKKNRAMLRSFSSRLSQNVRIEAESFLRHGEIGLRDFCDHCQIFFFMPTCLSVICYHLTKNLF